MKHKVRELEGALLDAAVALAEGWVWEKVPADYNGEHGGNIVLLPPGLLASGWDWPKKGPVTQLTPTYSTDWSHGGPIIDRERILVWPYTQDNYGDPVQGWIARVESKPEQQSLGPTPLIAVMRAKVASVYGEEVELP